MAHPSFSFPKGFYDIDEVSVSATDDFYAIQCYVAGDIEVEGGSRFEYVDVSELADDAAAAKYIDPSTGAPFASDDDAEDAGDGFYEKISTEATTITLAVGQTIYGSFSKITTPSNGNASVIAYNK